MELGGINVYVLTWARFAFRLPGLPMSLEILMAVLRARSAVGGCPGFGRFGPAEYGSNLLGVVAKYCFVVFAT